jgi:hypothetical protein
LDASMRRLVGVKHFLAIGHTPLKASGLFDW